MELNALKELRIADFDKKNNNIEYLRGFINTDTNITLSGYQLTGAQLFIKNLFNPHTLHKRLLINWQTGVGKSIAAISIANEFIKFFQNQFLLKSKPQMICVLGFNTSETIKADLLKFPELGYITEEEKKELNQLLLSNDPRYTQYITMLHKRISEKISGSYYKFFGYREFINNLILITDKGINNKINIQTIFNTDNDYTIIENYISKGYIKINNSLIDSLKNGIIICDEIHNVYNSLESNNYGYAIQYVLNILKDDAPRLVLMSATPITGNATEVIDLLNLLVPNVNLKRSDYFYKDKEGLYQLKDDTLDYITKLSTNKVSFVLDTDIELYPIRIFDGIEIENIPYLKFNICKLSDYHLYTLKQEENLTYSYQLRSIYDIIFPNPDDENIGLYNSSNIIQKIQQSNVQWKEKIGINVYEDNGVYIITGSFLQKENLKKYSIKYYNVLIDILNNIKNSGKIMIFHYNVQLSGVLLIQEIFKMNGFIDEISEPNNSTLCVICGIPLSNHNDDSHIYKPCRFIVAHSNINKLTLKKNMLKFNDITNLYGHEIKLIIGSRIIQEGLNFKAVRYQYILSFPINIPTLIQVLGRVVRKYSHTDLDPNDRNVHIKIYAYDIEISRYIYKSKEYSVIQQVEKALRINAVDNFINYYKNNYNEDKLELLSFKPTNINKPSIITKYFDSYGYNIDEINLIIRLLNLLFSIRPVWILDDIKTSIKDIDVNYNTDLINEDNIELAIQKIKNIHHIGKYYIKSDEVDIECFFRKRSILPVVNINLSNIYTKIHISSLYNNIMKTYYDDYLNNHIELSLVSLPSEFHIELLKQIILGDIKEKKIIELYKRFKILIFNDNIPIGYIDNISVNLYNSITKSWYNKSYLDYNIGKRYEENEYIVGYVLDDIIDTKLRLRDPIQYKKHTDLRSIKKGLVCENNTRNNLISILKNLQKIGKLLDYYNIDIDDNKIYYNKDICSIIKLYLLSFEEQNRSKNNGMLSSIRWVYLFHDNLPNIMLK